MSDSPRFLKKSGWTAVAGIGIFSVGFYLVTAFLLRRWLGNAPAGSSPPLEPVTFFRPIKNGDSGLRRNLEIFLDAIEPEDQVIFSATGGEELRQCERLAAGRPDLDIVCLRAIEGIYRNPKINKLAQMEALATRERWIVLDSDTIADRKFLRAFRGEWQLKNADAFSAPYAFEPACSRPARLDALGTGLSLWPGVALLRSSGRLDFLLGACMAVKAPALQALGGWKILGGSLADDHELGLLIRRAGGSVDIAATVLTVQAPDPGWKEWLLHQHRVFVTFRLCNPTGSLGIPLTQGVGVSFLFALLRPWSIARWLLHLCILLIRHHSANSLPGGKNSIRDVWLVSLFEPLFWVLSWLPLPIRWAGKWIRPEKLGA
ncbi:MAG: glycosyltransferase [Terrimicrobiaceae bacterium]